MLVESSALSAVGYLLFISDTSDSLVGLIVSPLLGEIQVRAVLPFLRHATIAGHLLIIEIDRQFLCSSSLYESQTGLR